MSPIKNLIIALVAAVGVFLFPIIVGKYPDFPLLGDTFVELLQWFFAVLFGWNVKAYRVKTTAGAGRAR